MASLQSFKGLTHASDQDPNWEGSPHPKIEINKCVLKWSIGKVQCFFLNWSHRIISPASGNSIVYLICSHLTFRYAVLWCSADGPESRNSARRLFGPCLVLEELNWIVSWEWKGIFSKNRERNGACISFLLQNKYRKAAHMKIASTAGVLGEKIMIDSTYNSLVNDQGRITQQGEASLKM